MCKFAQLIIRRAIIRRFQCQFKHFIFLHLQQTKHTLIWFLFESFLCVRYIEFDAMKILFFSCSVTWSHPVLTGNEIPTSFPSAPSVPSTPSIQHKIRSYFFQLHPPQNLLGTVRVKQIWPNTCLKWGGSNFVIDVADNIFCKSQIR